MRFIKKSDSAEEKNRTFATTKSSLIFLGFMECHLNGEYDFNKDENSGVELNLEKLKKVEILDISIIKLNISIY